MKIRKIGTRMEISRDLAIQYGVVEPTLEERAALDARIAEMDARTVLAWREYGDALQALGLIKDPLARKLLDIHNPTDGAWPRCQGATSEAWKPKSPNGHAEPSRRSLSTSPSTSRPTRTC